MERLETIDSYIEKLASNWNGKIIITSDHGMHSTGEGGDHGEFRFEDMVVPYIIINGDL
jgi:phosphopentomutase